MRIETSLRELFRIPISSNVKDRKVFSKSVSLLIPVRVLKNNNNVISVSPPPSTKLDSLSY